MVDPEHHETSSAVADVEAQLPPGDGLSTEGLDYQERSLPPAVQCRLAQGRRSPLLHWRASADAHGPDVRPGIRPVPMTRLRASIHQVITGTPRTSGGKPTLVR